MKRFLRRLWSLIAGTTRTSRSVTIWRGLHAEYLEADWCSHEFQRADGTWEKVIWDRRDGAERHYSSIDGGRTWAIIP